MKWNKRAYNKKFLSAAFFLLITALARQSSGECSKESVTTMTSDRQKANSIMMDYESLVNFTRSSG
ncbi:MAG: hypothetical protein JXJ22_15800 [Bacteroidales bacterium]|nr:hypothetical protein [Bacteroidales bacterium]